MQWLERLTKKTEMTYVQMRTCMHAWDLRTYHRFTGAFVSTCCWRTILINSLAIKSAFSIYWQVLDILDSNPRIWMGTSSYRLRIWRLHCSFNLNFHRLFAGSRKFKFTDYKCSFCYCKDALFLGSACFLPCIWKSLQAIP